MTSAASPIDIHAEGHAATRAVTRLSVGVAVLLIVLKAFALGASGSVSILASLADSALDLLASLGVFFAVRWAAAPADPEHRYGHGKAEALAGLVQAGLIFASAVFIGWEAVQRIFDPRPVAAGGWAVGVVVVSIAVTLWLVWMQTQALKKTSSLAVAGDRAHYAADLAANVVVLIGVISGAFLQAPGLDAAAGLVVAVWLFWGAISLLRESADHIVPERFVGHIAGYEQDGHPAMIAARRRPFRYCASAPATHCFPAAHSGSARHCRRWSTPPPP